MIAAYPENFSFSLEFGGMGKEKFYTVKRKKRWAEQSIRTFFESIRVEDKLIQICNNTEVSSPFSDGNLESLNMALELAFERPLTSIPKAISNLLSDLAWGLCFDYHGDGTEIELNRIKKNVAILIDAIFLAANEKDQDQAIKKLVSFYQNKCPHLKISTINIHVTNQSSPDCIGGGGSIENGTGAGGAPMKRAKVTSFYGGQGSTGGSPLH